MATGRNSNEQVVLDFFAGLNNNDMDAVRAQFAPEIKWTPMIKGLPDYDGESIFTELLAQIHNLFGPGDPQQAVQTITSADDTVVVETHCTGAVPSKDRHYVNDYCWVLEMKNGKIKTIREYVDMVAVRDIFV